ncbi:MAG: penicillin-binding protein 2, partial [Thermodesulfovibrionales bacterium]|nr:penicillin-binding protein 2 [Thermodesulfovibrionales bacterium]
MPVERKIIFIIAAAFFVLVMRLGQLQLFHGDELRRLSEENRLHIVKVPAPRGIIYDRNGEPLVENKPYFSVSLSPEMLGMVDLDAVSAFLGMKKEEISAKTDGRGKNSLGGIMLKEGLTFQEVAYIEARLSDYPGLSVEVDVMRNYLWKDVAAHVIGYLGRLNPRQAKSPELKDVPSHAFVGQWGVERVFDGSLRGAPGERVIEVDAAGRELRLIIEKPPVKGEDLYLSIDLNMQREAERAFGDHAGALVALKPDTGEVLALVSKPSFDPNLFAKGINYSDWIALQEDKRFPMLNRALQSQYPPGSVFKIVTGIAALEEKAVALDTPVTCTGGLSSGSWRFGCWRKEGHGTLSFHNALVQSCDVYFYTAGRRTGINSIASYARKLGLGSKVGLQLVEDKAGCIPDEDWKRKTKGQPWYQGETYIASIGQGYVLVTPLQAARLMSAIANGGHIYDVTLTLPESPRRPVRDIGVSEETLKEIKSALMGV